MIMNTMNIYNEDINDMWEPVLYINIHTSCHIMKAVQEFNMHISLGTMYT